MLHKWVLCKDCACVIAKIDHEDAENYGPRMWQIVREHKRRFDGHQCRVMPDPTRLGEEVRGIKRSHGTPWRNNNKLFCQPVKE